MIMHVAFDKSRERGHPKQQTQARHARLQVREGKVSVCQLSLCSKSRGGTSGIEKPMGNNLHDMAWHSWLNSISRLTSFAFTIKTSHKKQRGGGHLADCFLYFLFLFFILLVFLSSPKLPLVPMLSPTRTEYLFCQGYSSPPVVAGVLLLPT